MDHISVLFSWYIVHWVEMLIFEDGASCSPKPAKKTSAGSHVHGAMVPLKVALTTHPHTRHTVAIETLAVKPLCILNLSRLSQSVFPEK